MLKRRTWSIKGHKRGERKTQTLGSIRYVGQVTKSVALKRARRDYRNHVVTSVKPGSY